MALRFSYTFIGCSSEETPPGTLPSSPSGPLPQGSEPLLTKVRETVSVFVWASRTDRCAPGHEPHPTPFPPFRHPRFPPEVRSSRVAHYVVTRKRSRKIVKVVNYVPPRDEGTPFSGRGCATGLHDPPDRACRGVWAGGLGPRSGGIGPTATRFSHPDLCLGAGFASFPGARSEARAVDPAVGSAGGGLGDPTEADRRPGRDPGGGLAGC